MRVTNNMLIGNVNYNLNQTMKRMEFLNFQATTGKKFRIPSDDPIGASKSLKLRTDIARINQYKRNVDDANSWMAETESALKEVDKIIDRVKVLSNQAANETNSPEDLKAIKAEIDELTQSVFQIGNTSYGGRSIFTGYSTDKNLLKLDEDGKVVYNIDLEKVEKVNGKDPAQPGEKSYQIFEYNIGVSEKIEVNTLGNRVFGKWENETTDGTRSVSSDEVKEGDRPYLTALLEDLAEALESGDNPRLKKGLDELDKAKSHILSITSEVGARSNRLEMTKEKLLDQNVNLEDLLSSVEDVSIPEAYMKYQLEKNVLNASLAVGAQIIQPSLVDFLR